MCPLIRWRRLDTLQFLVSWKCCVFRQTKKNTFTLWEKYEKLFCGLQSQKKDNTASAFTKEAAQVFSTSRERQHKSLWSTNSTLTNYTLLKSVLVPGNLSKRESIEIPYFLLNFSTFAVKAPLRQGLFCIFLSDSLQTKQLVPMKSLAIHSTVTVFPLLTVLLCFRLHFFCNTGGSQYKQQGEEQEEKEKNNKKKNHNQKTYKWRTRSDWTAAQTTPVATSDKRMWGVKATDTYGNLRPKDAKWI